MSTNLACPVCTMTDLLDAGGQHECITCGHEWAKVDGPLAEDATDEVRVVKDANGTVLQDGDAITLVKGLKVKGGTPIKVGTKVTGIRLVDGDHEIDCKVDGQAIMLKAQFVKKA